MVDVRRRALGFHWIDQGRLTKVRHRGVESTWDEAIAAIAAALRTLRDTGNGARLGVIASSQLTNEELFLIRKDLSGARSGAQVTASVPTPGLQR